jgi:hypothetical protein
VAGEGGFGDLAPKWCALGGILRGQSIGHSAVVKAVVSPSPFVEEGLHRHMKNSNTSIPFFGVDTGFGDDAPGVCEQLSVRS